MSLGTLRIALDAPIPTWFGVGGGADSLATPRDATELRMCLEMDPGLRILGDGANLLVDDRGVGELVVSLTDGEFARVETSVSGDECVYRVGAGVNLPKLIVSAVREGHAGIEGLGGIPATIGGALVMNAGGSFGQIADSVRRVFAIDREGSERVIERAEIDFGYRRSGLGDLLLTGCELALRATDPEPLRQRLKDVMAFKKDSQPMAARSAGCCYRNPTLAADIETIGSAGERVSAGMVIDRAGCKGMTVGGASVSERHANFFPVSSDAKAIHVIELMHEVERRVHDRFGIALEREVVVWQRDDR